MARLIVLLFVDGFIEIQVVRYHKCANTRKSPEDSIIT